MPRQNETNKEFPERQSPSRPAHVMAFVSAKGGSGKTLLTATAAYLLARAGKRVLLVDTDFSTRGLTLYLMGPASRERHLVVRPTNCLSASLFDRLPVDSIEPRRIPRKDLSFDLILSSFQAWTSNKPDDRIVGDFADQDSGSNYFKCLDDLLKHFRTNYDYILVDTRGGYDFTSAAPALLCDEYVVVLEADQISVAQVYGLKEGIESWGRRYEVRPALSGFIINKATFTLETRSFPDTLFNLYGGAHFGTIPLDSEAVRAYQIRDIPTDSRPDSDFAFHSYGALERVFSPSLNWDKDECTKFEKLGSQIKLLWRARRSWQFAERILPAVVLVLALITAGAYFYVRNAKASVSLTPFYLSASIFVLASTLISAFILLKNIQKWRIPSLFRIALGVYGLCAALGLSYLTLIDVRRTFAKDALLSRLESQNQLIAQQTDRIASLSTAVSDAEQKLQFASADKDRIEQQLQSAQNQLARFTQTSGGLVGKRCTGEKDFVFTPQTAGVMQLTPDGHRVDLGDGGGGTRLEKWAYSWTAPATVTSVKCAVQRNEHVLAENKDGSNAVCEGSINGGNDAMTMHVAWDGVCNQQ
jgi:cellulose biosynthesis protein BcsQ